MKVRRERKTEQKEPILKEYERSARTAKQINVLTLSLPVMRHLFPSREMPLSSNIFFAKYTIP